VLPPWRSRRSRPARPARSPGIITRQSQRVFHGETSYHAGQGTARGPAGQRRRYQFRDACARPGLPLIEALPGNQHDITGRTSREQAAHRRQRPGASAGEDRCAKRRFRVVGAAAREIAGDPVISGSRSKASPPSPPQLTDKN
jgi:hypothetical protein